MAENDAQDKLKGFDWRAFTPDDSPMTPMDVMADPRHQDLQAPTVQPGGPAYNFRSQIYDYSDGTRVATGVNFDLLETAQNKPVALIFGSYT